MLSQIVSALGVVVVAVFACSAYFYFSNKIGSDIRSWPSSITT